MFDIGFPELFIVAVLAIIVIGPRDLPNAIRSVMGVVRKVREMGSEFKTGMKKMADEVELDSVTRKLNEAGNIKLDDSKPATESSNDFSNYKEFDYDDYDYDGETKSPTPNTENPDAAQNAENEAVANTSEATQTSDSDASDKTNKAKATAGEGKADD